MNKTISYGILMVLAVAGIVSTVIADHVMQVVILMTLSYFSNVAYSLQSRSAVRDSILYHAVTTLLANIVFYLVLQRLVTDNMSLVLFVPYTVATVYGSVNGSKLSQKLETFFGITTDSSRKKATPQSVKAQKLLLVFLALLGIIVGMYTKNITATMTIAALSFGNNVTFSLLRRSRNTSNAMYHVGAFIFQSMTWYLMFRSLSLKGMPFDLFVPYCFGSVLGGISGQEVSAWIERKIGATADAHLSQNTTNFIPWKLVFILVLPLISFITLFGNYSFFMYFAFLSATQQVSFSLVSRSRQRNNVLYHTIASILSNGIWFLTFRALHVEHWTMQLYIPYMLGGVIGSVIGVGISMIIEKKLYIVSDSVVPQKT